MKQDGWKLFTKFNNVPQTLSGHDKVKLEVSNSIEKLVSLTDRLAYNYRQFYNPNDSRMGLHKPDNTQNPTRVIIPIQ